MESRFVTIATYQVPYEAEIAASILEERNIPTNILDDNMNILVGGLVEIRLQVPEENAEEARRILESAMEEGVDLLEDMGAVEEEEPVPEKTSSLKYQPEGDYPIVCPRCGSQNSLKSVPSPVPMWLNALLLGLPGLFFPGKLQCRGCGTVFT